MMNRYRPLLGVHAHAEHRRRTKDDADVTAVHGLHHRLLGLLVLAFLDETDLRRRDAVVLHELALDLRVHVPFARLVCSEVREDELRTLLLVILSIVLAEQLGAMAGFVVDVIRVFHRIVIRISRLIFRARSVAISILAFSSFSLSGARSKIVASPVLANSISLPMNASCSGVGGMWCRISRFSGRSMPMSPAMRKSQISP